MTLGGLLIWRNVGWYITSGQTIGPLDETFQAFGGINGTLGAQWSWIAGLLAAVVAVLDERQRDDFAKIDKPELTPPELRSQGGGGRGGRGGGGGGRGGGFR